MTEAITREDIAGIHDSIAEKIEKDPWPSGEDVRHADQHRAAAETIRQVDKGLASKGLGWPNR